MFTKIPLHDDLSHEELLKLAQDKFRRLEGSLSPLSCSALLVDLQQLRARNGGNDRLTLVEFLLADVVGS